MVLVLILASQPLSATTNTTNQKIPEIGATKITGPDGKPLQDITVQHQKPIRLSAQLHVYKRFLNKEALFKGRLRTLVFRVREVKANGHIGKEVWADQAMTNLFTGNAHPEKFTLKRGIYRLTIVYGAYRGNLKPCHVRIRIYVK